MTMDEHKTLREMYTGILVLGVICQIAGCFWFGEILRDSCSLWFGCALSAVSLTHMYRTLTIALSCDEQNAAKMIQRGYLLRYVAVVIIFGIVMFTKVLQPLIVFLGYMTLKGTAYLQPLTHKFYNFILHETDPEPEPEPDEPEQSDEEEVSVKEQ